MTAEPIIPRYWHRPDRPAKHVIVWQQGGRRRFRAFKSKALAMTWAQALVRNAMAGLTADGSGLPWDEAVRMFRDNKAGRSSAYQHDIGKALITLRLFAEAKLGTALEVVEQITPELLDSYFAEFSDGLAWINERGELRTRQPTATERLKDYRVLKTFFRLLVLRRKLAHSPLVGVATPPAAPVVIEVPATEEWIHLLSTVTTLKDALDAQAWYVLILLAGITGIDRDDLLALPLEAIDTAATDDGFGLITASRSKRRTTARENVQYHGLAPTVNAMVATRLQALAEDGQTRLFPWRSFQRKQWARLCQAAGWPYTFKALRKLSATQAAEYAAMAAAAEQLGHSSQVVTRRHYADAGRVTRAVIRAQALRLPTLPPLPAYQPQSPTPSSTPAAPLARTA